MLELAALGLWKLRARDDMDHREIRIVILHSNRLFRESLALILDQQKTISVVHAVAGFDQTEGELTSLQPHLILLDFGVPGRGGLEDARRIRAISSDFKILIIGVPDTEADILACIEVGGASGYLLQNASVEDMVSSVMAVAAGETLCSPRIASLAFSRISALAHQTVEPGPNSLAHLTRRELEIIALIEGGLSNKEIATRLHIEVQTVKNHVHNILDKLQLNGRREAARYAKEKGLAASWP